MRVFRNASASLTTLASLGALYGVIVVLTVLLSNRILANPDAVGGSSLWVLVLIAALLPLGLVVAVTLTLLRLQRDRRQGKPGAAFKARLTGFFSIVVLLAAVPQGIVAIGVLSSAMQLLFNAGTGESLRHGLDLALDYYDERIHDLEVLAADGTIQRAVNSRRPELLVHDRNAAEGDGAFPQIWPELLRRHPRAEGFQLYDGAGQELLFLGNEATRRDDPPAPLSPGDSGRVNRISLDGVGLLRLTARVDLSGVDPAGNGLAGNAPAGTGASGLAVLTVGLPRGFEQKAAEITDTIQVFSRLEALRPAFVLVVALMYGFFSLPLLLLSILASFFFSDRIIRPIESMEEATRRVTEGDYSVRILSRPGEDLGAMVTSFNRMVNELDRARRRIAQAEKVQAWQEIAQRLAHEVKNPLTPIRLAAERLRRRYHAGAEDFPHVLERTTNTIVRETEALTALLNEFRSFSRLPGPSKEDVQLRRLCAEAAAVYGEDPDISIDMKGIDEALVIHADRGQLRQVFVNLLTNAVEASGRKVHVSCAADIIEQGEDRACRIRIEDDGPGIPDDLREQIFQPYVTSKPDGTGLGLAIVERIVYDHDGRIHVESAPGSGTTFVITLPVDAPVTTDGEGS
jgi:two-component system, NtrC family, nitrogen regulation sensor histidine kinase NtrY